MIKDVQFWREWEDEYLRNQPADFARNLALVEAMYKHARALGAFPPADPWEGIEAKIRIARAFNVQSSPGTDRK
jgi:hypothetical protein